ncbi:MAG: nucleoside phosphorylase [Thermomicrobiales bacterium]|nr:nucleoside phosphorylase [Thermomicrobiales bacterium]
MPIQDTFDPLSPEIFQARRIIDPIPDFPEVVIVTYTRRIFDLMLEQHDAIEIGRMYTSAMIHPVYVFESNGVRLATYLSSIGAPASAGLMEEAIAMGATTFLYFGSCGALNDDVLDGHIAVPTAAWRDEGVSYHYIPAADTIEIPTAQRLSEILDELEVPHHSTIAWTTDAIYRETRDTMAKRRAAGCGVVEMEAAANQAVAQMRGVQYYQFVYGADSLAGEEWDPRTLAEFPQDQREFLAELAVRIAERLP